MLLCTARKSPPGSLSEVSTRTTNDPIATYKTNKMHFPNQYCGWIHSFVTRLRNYADQHAKQREHAGGIRL
jgi:hypothetical protein